MNKKPIRTETYDQLAKERKKFTAISLFSGCGGAALGLRQAGFEIRVFVEWDKDACNTLRTNWTRQGRKDSLENELLKAVPDMTENQKKYWMHPQWWQKRDPAILQEDITKLTTEEILKAADLKVGEAFILEGGFPCQEFSTAGQRMMNDPRNQLYKECVWVIREALPRTFMLENVKGLISMGGGKIIKQICEDLAACGYNVSWHLLDACDYGVPQHRERVFFIGQRVDVMTFDFKKERPALHMGAFKGKVHHPDFFKNKYKDLFLIKK